MKQVPVHPILNVQQLQVDQLIRLQYSHQIKLFEIKRDICFKYFSICFVYMTVRHLGHYFISFYFMFLSIKPRRSKLLLSLDPTITFSKWFLYNRLGFFLKYLKHYIFEVRLRVVTAIKWTDGTRLQQLLVFFKYLITSTFLKLEEEQQ